jgi:hypothetical protein
MERFGSGLSPLNDVIIHGDAPGADTIVGNLARKYGIANFCFPAHWETYGLAAGPIRNMRMLKECKPELVVGFHNDITKSKGTKNMLKIATDAGVKVILKGSGET